MLNKEKILLLFSGIPYLFRDLFTTTTAAPLPTPLTAEPTGGWTVVDTGNNLSKSGGQLVGAGFVAAGNPRIVSTTSWTRQSGLALLFDMNWTTARGMAGWTAVTNPTTNPTLGVGDASAILIACENGLNTLDSTNLLMSTGILYSFACILRTTGGFVFVKGGAYTNWTLLMVANTSTASPLYAASFARAAGFSIANDNFRVIQFNTLFSTDYSFATNYTATTVGNGTSTQLADAYVEHTIVAATGITQEIWTRKSDVSNYWIIRMNQTGSTIKVIEYNAGVETERSSAAMTWTNATAYRIHVIMNGNVFRTYVQTGSTAFTAKNYYSSASFNNTATGVQVSHAGTELVCWPLTVATFPYNL